MPLRRTAASQLAIDALFLVPLQVVVILAAVTFVAGCRDSNDILAQVAPNTADQLPATSKRKVFAMTRDHAEWMKKHARKLLRVSDSIYDEESAREAMSEMDEMLQKVAGKIQRKVDKIVVEMAYAEFKEMESELKAIEDEAKESNMELKESFTKMGKKLGSNSSISYRTKSMIVSKIDEVARAPAAYGVPIVCRFPASEIATVVIENAREASELKPYLQEKNHFDLAQAQFANGVHRMRFGSIRDLQKFADRIDIGRVVRVNTRTRAILLKLSESDIDTLNRMARERKEKAERWAKEREEKQKQTEEERERQREQRVARAVESAVKDRNKHGANGLAILKRINSIQSAQDNVEALKGVRREFWRRSGYLDRAQERYRKEMGKELALEGMEDAVLQEIQAELDRLHGDTKIRMLLARNFGQDLDARSLLHGEEPRRGYANPAKDRSHTDYFAANLMDLTAGHWTEKRAALKRLGTSDPKKVKDIELRKEIARAIRDIIVSSDANRNGDALQAFVVWGGKYSVPILLEILENNRRHGGSRQVFDALAKYPTPESATAVAQSVGNFFSNDQACRCLVKMGSAAEDAVMEIAPSNDAKVSLAAVVVLGKIGTEKSLPLLRKATRSSNASVRQAATIAIKKIRARADKNRTEEAGS